MTTTSITTQPARSSVRPLSAIVGFVAGAVVAGSISLGVGLTTDDNARPTDRPPAGVGSGNTPRTAAEGGCLTRHDPC